MIGGCIHRGAPPRSGKRPWRLAPPSPGSADTLPARSRRASERAATHLPEEAAPAQRPPRQAATGAASRRHRRGVNPEQSGERAAHRLEGRPLSAASLHARDENHQRANHGPSPAQCPCAHGTRPTMSQEALPRHARSLRANNELAHIADTAARVSTSLRAKDDLPTELASDALAGGVRANAERACLGRAVLCRWSAAWASGEQAAAEQAFGALMSCRLCERRTNRCSPRGNGETLVRPARTRIQSSHRSFALADDEPSAGRSDRGGRPVRWGTRRRHRPHHPGSPGLRHSETTRRNRGNRAK